MFRRIYNSLRKAKKSISRKMKKIVPIYVPVLQNELLKDRKAIITGGTKGIGYEIAKSFLNSGANVIITGRNEETIDNAVKKLIKETNCEGNVFGVVLNNLDLSTFQKVFDECVKKVGMIDILVNNAGVNKGEPYGKITQENYDNTLNTNLRGTFMLSQIVSNYMRDNKIKGNILNICSSSSLRPAITPYTLSKWGLRGLTLGLAKTLAPYDIIVNGLAPGPTATEMLINDGYDGIEREQSPLGRFATAIEIANMAVILVSDMARMTTGDIIYMTGGGGTFTFDDINYTF